MCCWFLCVSFLSCLATFILGLYSLFVLKLATSLPLHVLIGPGLPLPSPTDAAQPTTAQCTLPAAPRDWPRTSLSLFPHSSSLVRRGRDELKKKKKRSRPSESFFIVAGVYRSYVTSRSSNQVCGNLGSPSSSHRYRIFSCIGMHYYYWLFAAKIQICGPTRLWACGPVIALVIFALKSPGTHASACHPLLTSFVPFCFFFIQCLGMCLHFFFFFMLCCSPAICSTSNTPHPKQTTYSNNSICTPASTDLLPYTHTCTRSEGEVVTDVSMVMCNVLLAGQYLARTSCRPPAHQPLSEHFPPPRPLLPPSLPPSHAAASPHHQKQTSVWRPKRVRTLRPIHLFHSHSFFSTSLWCYSHSVSAICFFI